MSETIGATIKLNGEAEYKAALRTINEQIKESASAHQLLSAVMQATGQTTDTLKAKDEALAKEKEQLQQKIALLNGAIEQATSKEKVNEAQVAKWGTALNEAKLKLVGLQEQTTQSVSAFSTLDTTIKAQETEISGLREQYASLIIEKQGDSAASAVLQTKIQTLSETLSANKAQMAGVSEQAGIMSGTMAKVRNSFTDIYFATMMLSQYINKLETAFTDVVDASITFESAMAGVQKTTGVTDETLASMADDIQNMATTIPMTTTELANIEEVAGQLGIKAENLTEFTEAMAKLGTATNMTSEDAATMLAQFATVTGLDVSQYENLGSSIVELGNNFATTEQNIVEMSHRFAAVGTYAGMSEADILGFSAAITSVGIESEMGGTNLQKLISQMQIAVETGENLDKWAEIAGVSAQEFADLWGTSATDALVKFIQGIGDSEESVASVLGTLGLTNERIITLVTSLAGAESESGFLTKAVNMSNDAWEENIALTKEAETRYETTESKITMLNNAFGNVKTSIGDLFTGALADASTGLTPFLNGISELIETNDGAKVSIELLVAALGTLTVAASITIVVGQLSFAFSMLSASAQAAMLSVAAAVGAVAPMVLLGAGAILAAKQMTDSWKGASDSILASAEKYGQKAGSGWADSFKASVRGSLSGLDVGDGEEETGPDFDTVKNDANLIGSIGEFEAANEEAVKSSQETRNAIVADAEAIQAALDNKSMTSVLIPVSASAELKQYPELLGNAAAALEKYNSIADGMDDGSEFAEKYGAVADALQGVVDAWNSAYNAAYSSISGQLGLFDMLDTEVEYSLADVQENLDKQGKFLDDYLVNMKTAMERGVDEGLVESLSDGSAQSAAILAALATATDEEIANMNASFAKVQDGKDAFSTAVAEMSDEFQISVDIISVLMDDFVDTLNRYDEAYKNGAYTIEGFRDGIYANLAYVVNAGTETGIAMWDAYRTYMEIASPSKRMMEAGQDTINGLTLGIESGYATLDDAMTSIASRVYLSGYRLVKSTADTIGDEISIVIEKLNDVVDAAGDAIDKSDDAAEAAFDELKETAKEYTDALDNMNDAWNSAYEEAYNGIDKIADMFKPIDLEVEISVGDAISNLTEQAQYINEYTVLLGQAMGRGLNQGLLEELSDGTAESYKLLQSLVSGPQEQIDQLNEAFSNIATAKSTFSASVAAMDTEYQDAVDNLVKVSEDMVSELDKYDAAYSSGENTVQGLIDGMLSMINSVANAGSAIGESLADSYNAAMEIQSPSRVMERAGQMTIEGLRIGIESGMEKLVNTSEYMKNKLASESDLSWPTYAQQRIREASPISSAVAIDYDMLAMTMVGAMKEFKPNVILDDKKVGQFVVDRVEKVVYG